VLLSVVIHPYGTSHIIVIRFFWNIEKTKRNGKRWGWDGTEKMKKMAGMEGF
jgi:hypothetical protein